MFLALIRKQIKLLLRSPSEILTLLVMPIVLICILSFALGSLMEGSSEMTMIEFAVIEHSEEEEEFQSFINAIQKTIQLDNQAIESIKESLPVSLLLNQLNNEKMQEFIHVTQLDGGKLEEVKDSGDYSVVLEIPKGFTTDYLNSIIFD